MTCKHTGATVWLDEYDAYGICDAHRIGDTAVFRISGTLIHGPRHDPETMYTVRRIEGGWFGRNETFSTLVVPLTSVVMPTREATDRRWH